MDSPGPYYSSQKADRYANANDGRRYFDNTVLQHIIDVLAPESQGTDAAHFKIVYREPPLCRENKNCGLRTKKWASKLRFNVRVGLLLAVG